MKQYENVYRYTIDGTTYLGVVDVNNDVFVQFFDLGDRTYKSFRHDEHDIYVEMHHTVIGLAS